MGTSRLRLWRTWKNSSTYSKASTPTTRQHRSIIRSPRLRPIRATARFGLRRTKNRSSTRPRRTATSRIPSNIRSMTHMGRPRIRLPLRLRSRRSTTHRISSTTGSRRIPSLKERSKTIFRLKCTTLTTWRMRAEQNRLK
ncbi:hypothetical protein SDC9_207562 [bioreactor metagenome]|uniref:Uncharacterized protein n=1 Tax=bioreactor metagenome TaxID=1076179 RepID=A0A645J9L8_9ZZZZ